MNTVFYEVKECIDMHTVAAYYGFTPNRGNYICCPFHSEKTPSMRLYERYYHCFGCGAHGDVIGFVSHLYDLAAIEAVAKLNTDFSLGLNISKTKDKPMTTSKVQLHNYYMEWEKEAFRVLNGYYKLLKMWYEAFTPRTPYNMPYPLWVRSCNELPKVKWYCMILMQGNDEERQHLFINHRGEIKQIADEYYKYII